MSTIRLTALSALLISSAFACTTGAPPKEPDQAPLPTGTGQPEAEKTSVTPQTPPEKVDTPKNVLMMARVRNPRRAMETMSNWAGLGNMWRTALDQEIPGNQDVVLFDAPVEMAMTLSAGSAFPVVRQAWSIGLTSFRAGLSFAEHMGGRLKEIETGVYYVSKHGDSCALARARGMAPARLICGTSRGDLEALVPFMARGLPEVNMGDSDAHWEFRMDTVRNELGGRVGRFKGLGKAYFSSKMKRENPRYDRAIADVVHEVLEEGQALVNDIDLVTVDATLAGERMNTKAVLRMRGKKSWTAQALLDAKNATAPAPDLFWSLPEDSYAGLYGNGGWGAKYAKMRDTFVDLVNGYLETEKVSRVGRAYAVDFVKKSWLPDAPMAYGFGPIPFKKRPTSGPWAPNAIRNAVGWHLIGYNEPATKITAQLNRAMKVLNERTIRPLIEDFDYTAKHLSKVSARGPKGKGAPRGTRVYEVSIPGKQFNRGWSSKVGAKPARVAPLVFSLAVIPNGKQTWVGLSADETALYKVFAQVKSKQSSLKGRTDLQLLRRPGVAGGFLRVPKFFQQGPRAWEDGTTPDLSGSAIPFVAVVSDGSGGPTLTIEAEAQSSSFANIGGIIRSIFTVGRSYSTSPSPVVPVPVPPPPPPRPNP